MRCIETPCPQIRFPTAKISMSWMLQSSPIATHSYALQIIIYIYLMHSKSFTSCMHPSNPPSRFEQFYSHDIQQIYTTMDEKLHPNSISNNVPTSLTHHTSRCEPSAATTLESQHVYKSPPIRLGQEVCKEKKISTEVIKRIK
ncbi:hypothetical protein I7I53_01229 [Histoplasma capsulatum var. duboisii H88]|uniref:Uncharacterized protein n=1 Tax=Ajellomyces capsulatus (strain H88) TaxID=544711 RepID=A0A8A1LJ04_AJEC8|nr:hypothetical protein I7I53_01229 [Histoplasma capsulatum var. duboisii H88]